MPHSAQRRNSLSRSMARANCTQRAPISPSGTSQILNCERVSLRSSRGEANEPSGGQMTDIEIGDFLTSGGHGPQHTELLRLIGTLVGLRSDA
jgi:hypothetical protein